MKKTLLAVILSISMLLPSAVYADDSPIQTEGLENLQSDDSIENSEDIESESANETEVADEDSSESAEDDEAVVTDSDVTMSDNSLEPADNDEAITFDDETESESEDTDVTTSDNTTVSIDDVSLGISDNTVSINEVSENEIDSLGVLLDAGISFETATAINTNQAYQDCIKDSTNKYRYYKFTTPSDGSISFSFWHTSINGHYRFSLFKENQTLLYQYSDYAGCEGSSDERVNTYSAGLPAGTYVFRVENYSGSGHGSTNFWNFIVNFRSSSNYETEDNDTMATADTMTYGQTMNGALIPKPGPTPDYDYYKIYVPAAGKYQVHANHEYNTGYMYINICTPALTPVLTNNYFSYYNIEYDTEPVQLDKGYYYIEVHGKTPDYRLKLIPWAGLKVPKIKKFKYTSKSKTTVKWDKVSGADGYEIQLSKHNNFPTGKTRKYSVNSPTIKHSIKRLSTQKWHCRVRAFKYYNGKKFYSNWSKTKSTVVKK